MAIPTERKRRDLRGLVVDRRLQYKLAVGCASLLLLPALVICLGLTNDLVREAVARANEGASALALAELVMQKAFVMASVTTGVFLVLSIVSIYLSLRMSNAIVGPVHRLENQVRGMLNGDFSNRPDLRKDDYLKEFSELLNQLSEKLEKKRS